MSYGNQTKPALTGAPSGRGGLLFRGAALSVLTALVLAGCGGGGGSAGVSTQPSANQPGTTTPPGGSSDIHQASELAAHICPAPRTGLHPSPSPPYPDQPSGYNGVTGGFMYTAKAFFNGNAMRFDLTATVTVGVPQPTVMTRHYKHFTDVLDNTIDARILQGIHFRTPDWQGAEMGQKAAALAAERLAPVK